jgi:hypothetical protein
MWTLIVTTLVFAGAVTGGVAVNTIFLDFRMRRNVGGRLRRPKPRSG